LDNQSLEDDTGHFAGAAEMVNTYKFLVGKSEGRRLLGKHRCR
jgi:hypothetical protein